MPAQFVYGRRNGQWTHIRDLDPAIHRGRLCGCVCHGCGRALQAHMGESKAWHFQHDVDDGNCNPQPMTLLHAFVRDRLAERRQLWLPGGAVEVVADVWGTRRTEFVEIQDRVYEFSEGKSEHPVGDLQPDVVFTIPGRWDLALEVRKTHAVDAAKGERLRSLFKDAIEFDVSDLPAAGITESELDQALKERHRWKWVSWMEHRQAETRFRNRLSWELKEWRVDIGFFTRAMPYKPDAAAKLRQAQKRLVWAKGELARIKLAWSSKRERAEALGALELTDRFAVACAAMELQPEDLPVFFAQRVQLGMQHHPYAWQLPVFAAFGLGDKAFGSDVVAAWAEIALPDCVWSKPDERTRNGFNQTRAALHGYLAQLVAQGLLLWNGRAKAEDQVFQPVFARRSDFLAFLSE